MAVYKAPGYKADTSVSKSAQLHLSPPGLEYINKNLYECRSGILSLSVLPIMSNDAIVDPSRAPPGKNLTKFLIPNVPNHIKSYYQEFSKKFDWTVIKDFYSDKTINMISENYYF